MIRLLIVDERCEICDRWAAGLSHQPDIEVLECVNSLSAALARLQDCDLVLVSSELGADGAYHLVREASQPVSTTTVLVAGPANSTSAVIRYLEAGAFGYICLESGIKEVLGSIFGASRGEVSLSPDLTAALIKRLAELNAWLEEIAPNASLAATLTRREREVLRLIGQDYTNQDIANHLIIEVGTVKNHVHNILAKLKVNSRHDAASYVNIVQDRPLRRNRQVASEYSEHRYL